MESLVGKDELFVLEKLHCMANNEETVKEQKETIKNLTSEVEDSKEEISFLKRKLDQKYDIIDDLERDLDKFDDLEKDIRKKAETIKALQYGMESKSRMVDDLIKIRKENEEECSKLKKKFAIQNNVMHLLKETLKEKENDSMDKEDVDKLAKEIKQLQMSNREKEMVLENVQSENEMLKEKLKDLQNTHLEEDVEESISIDEELASDVRKIFKCKECDEKFGSLINIKQHKKTIME